MKTRTQSTLKVSLILLFAVVFILGASGQWPIGGLVSPPFPPGDYISMGHPEWPDLPFVPRDLPVYYLGTLPGTTNNAFAYDDRPVAAAQRSSTQTTDDPPPVPGGDDGTGGGSYTNTPWGGGQFDIGSNLYLLIGPTNVVTGPVTDREAWMVLTNTQHGFYYQLENRPNINPGTPWQFGQLLQDTGSSYQVRFSNVSRNDPSQRFFRGAGGQTIVSIGLDPDSNLAVAPAAGVSGQAGYFVVSTTTNTGTGLTVTYQVSGSASNGVDYTSLSGSVTIPGTQLSAQILVTPLLNSLAGLDESVTLTLAVSDGYLVDPNSASATMKIYPPRPSGMAVAIHDSGWTRAHGSLPTNWNYFVMPESVKEALRSDGTPYVVVSDLDIASGKLQNSDGTPKYPMLISLAAEAIRNDEIAPLTNYVAAGGFLLVGSSSFTRDTNGNSRGDFAIGNEMGIHCNPTNASWLANYTFSKQIDHRLVGHFPGGVLTSRMPTSSEENSWGTCANRVYSGPHQIWPVSVSNQSVLVLASADASRPYLAVNPYDKGQFIYTAALEPLIGHGGNAPGMYAYRVLRSTIEWAFESARLPLARLSAWPYTNDAAFMVRHDLENYTNEIDNLESSAAFESAYGARGDYYFCTGTLREDAAPGGYDTNAIITKLQRAVTNYGATIGPHNGGLANPVCNEARGVYEYWHWGPDEALDLAGGRAYASNSMAISFQDIDTWLGPRNPRAWVVPFFNGTREDSYAIQEQLGVKIAGEQKLSPFPSWTLSTKSEANPYHFLSEPVSDWFVGGEIAQAMGYWQGHYSGPGVHTFASMHNAVDAYYGLGALINVYSHSLSTALTNDLGGAGNLVPDYILYCTNPQIHPRTWAANATGVYQWWLERSAAQVTAAYTISAGNSITTISIDGPHTNTGVEVLVPGRTAFHSLVVHTNSGIADTNDYRVSGGVVKVRAGPDTTTVQVQYVPDPTANDDTFVVRADYPSVPAPGVLSNDFSPRGTTLTPTKTGGDSGVTLNTDGSFTGPSTPGRYTFTYTVNDGQTDSAPSTVNLLVAATNAWYDDFTRAPTDPAPWEGWLDAVGPPGGWTIGNGLLMGAANWNTYAIAYNTNASWTNYSVEARISFPPGAFGGGVGGRVAFNPATTNWVRYAAWVYPEGSPGGSLLLKLVQFTAWTSFSELAHTNLTAVGTNWHKVKLSFDSNHIEVYFDDPINPVISLPDTSSPHLNGGVSLEMFNWSEPGVGPSYNMSVDDVIVTPLQ